MTKNLINLFLISFVLLLFSCKNDSIIPIVNTLLPTPVTDTSAICSAEIINDGYATIIEKGFCYDTNPNPTIANSFVIDTTNLDTFSCILSNLVSGKTYYIRAYAKNSVGIGYGNEVNFTTSSLRKYLIAYYPLNGNAKDVSGNGHNGSVYGTLTPTIDRKGKANCAYEFDGNSSYIEIPSSSLIKPVKEITLSAWVCPYTNKENDDIIVLSYNGTCYPYTSYGIGKLYNKKITFICTTGSNSSNAESTTIEGSTVLVPNTWYMVTATYDGSYMKLYINGVLENSTALTGSLIYYNENPLKLGHSVYTQFFRGKLDEIKIYNKALNQTQITQLYNEY